LTQSGDILTAQAGTWTPPSTAYDWQWQRCDSSLSCTTVKHDPGQGLDITDTYTLGNADVGFSIRVLVAPTGPDGTLTWVPVASAPTAVITESGAESSAPVEDATALASTLAGPGISVTSATFQGSPDQVGSFSRDPARIGSDSGVGISTGLFSGGSGCAKGVQGPNQCTNDSSDFRLRR
jgi:hypothetical protein